MNPKKISWIFIVFGISFIVWGVFYFDRKTRLTLYHDAHRLADSRLTSMAVSLNQEIERNKNRITLSARNETAWKAVNQENSETTEQANELCDIIAHSLEPAIVFIMDEDGRVVASSNRFDETSFLGKNYHFRPYFQLAKAGEPNCYFAFGVTTKKRGEYFAAPIIRDGVTKGALVMKQFLDPLDLELKENSESGQMCVLSPEGLVFASSNSDWALKLIDTLDSEHQQGLASSRQFGLGPFESVGLKPLKNPVRMLPHELAFVSPEEGLYTLHEVPIRELSGWRLVYFYDIKQIEEELINPVSRQAFISILPALLVVVIMTLFLFFSLLRALNKEESLVLQLKKHIEEIHTLRGILPICCYCKKIRTDEDAWSNIEAYLSSHSEAEISHGICPDCMKTYNLDLGLEEDEDLESLDSHDGC